MSKAAPGLLLRASRLAPSRSAYSRAYRICGRTPLYTGEDRGAGWVEKIPGWSTEVVRHPPKPVPEEVM